jgi:uncharacterized protein with ParB-like and HNH nuclease domain
MSDDRQLFALRPIAEFLNGKYSFVIPSYQRGFRWKPEQVKALLDDLYEFHTANRDNKKDNPFYCLQPVIVCKKEKENEWEVIDGQQRLTTIYIIVKYLESHSEEVLEKPFNKKPFNIKYVTRKDSGDFLKNIKNSIDRKSENIDYFYFCEAWETVDTWFKDKPEQNKKNAFSSITTILTNDSDNAQIIWYDVTENLNLEKEKEADIFSNFNVGKIPLTNAELVKALVLKKDNFKAQTENKPQETLNQLHIATDWDLIENNLHSDEFWAFLYNNENPLKYETRIEYILDLMYNKNQDKETFFTFNKIQDELKKENNLDDLWNRIKGKFLLFDEWFRQDNRGNELYHLIGFLIQQNGWKVNDIIGELSGYFFDDKNKEKTKTDFKKWIRRKINDKFKDSLQVKDNSDRGFDDLSYPDDSVLIRSILLLFNLETLIASKNDQRFPFHNFKHYKNEGWDIEHIYPQTPTPEEMNYEKRNLEDILERFIGTGDHEKADEKIKRYEKAKLLEPIEANLARETVKILSNKKINVPADYKAKIETYFVEKKKSE